MPITVACACGKTLRVSDTHAGKRVRCPGCNQVVAVPAEEEAVEVFPVVEEPSESYGVHAEDQGLAASLPGQSGEQIRSFRGAIHRVRLSAQRQPVSCVAYAADHRHALASLDRTVHVLNARSGERAYRLAHHAEAITSLAASANGRLALAGDEAGNLLLWELAGGRLVSWLDWHRTAVETLAFSPAGDLAASGDADGYLCVWDLKDGRAIQRLGERDDPVTCLTFSPDGGLIAYATDSGRVPLWDIMKGKHLVQLPCSGTPTGIAFSVDGARLIAVGLEKSGSRRPFAAWQWEIVDLSRLKCLSDPSETKANISCIALSPDGHRALTAGESREKCPFDDETRLTRFLELWNVTTGHRLHNFEGHEHKVRSLAISRDGRRAISGDNGAVVMIWGLPI
jgi:WD40 repeat protein